MNEINTSEGSIKIGTEEESFWYKLKKKLQKDLDDQAHNMIIAAHVMKLADEKLEEESKV